MSLGYHFCFKSTEGWDLFQPGQQFCLSVCNSSPTMHHSHLSFYVHYSPEFTGASYGLGLPSHNLCCSFMSQIEYLTWTFFPSCDGQRSKLNQAAPPSRPHSYICLPVSIVLQTQISEIWGQMGRSNKAVGLSFHFAISTSSLVLFADNPLFPLFCGYLEEVILPPYWCWII